MFLYNQIRFDPSRAASGIGDGLSEYVNEKDLGHDQPFLLLSLESRLSNAVNTFIDI